MNKLELTFFVEGIGSAIDRDHTTTGRVLATASAGKYWLSVRVKSHIPQEDGFRSVVD